MRKMRGLLLAGLLTVAACGDDEPEAAMTPADSARAAEQAVAATALLTPVRAVSLAEVEFGDMAAQRAGAPAVREYARTVAADHRALIVALDSVAQVRSLSLVESRESQELSNTVRMAHSGLENVTGQDFDLPFVRAEVESHRLLLDRLDQQLISVSSDTELQEMLTDTRAMVDAHLARARQLLADQLGQTADPAQPQAPARQTPAPQTPPAPVPSEPTPPPT